MNGLTYRDDIHEYRYSGAVVPSVTQILAPLSAIEYRGVARDVMDRAADLGRAVHKMIELDLHDDLDIASMADELQPYYTAWRSFLATSGFRAVLSEQRVYSDKRSFAGTLDLAGWLNDRFCIIDAKRTAAVPRTAGPQTAAYLEALQSMSDSSLPKAAAGIQKFDAQRYALHFNAEGKWKLVPFTDKSDLRVFLACLTLHNWQESK